VTARRWLTAAMCLLVGVVAILAAPTQQVGATIKQDRGELEVPR
jgi:hypothetical protein